MSSDGVGGVGNRCGGESKAEKLDRDSGGEVAHRRAEGPQRAGESTVVGSSGNWCYGSGPGRNGPGGDPSSDRGAVLIREADLQGVEDRAEGSGLAVAGDDPDARRSFEYIRLNGLTTSPEGQDCENEQGGPSPIPVHCSPLSRITGCYT